MGRHLLTGVLAGLAALAAPAACSSPPERAATSIGDWSAEGDLLHLGVDSCQGDPEASVVETATDVTVSVTTVRRQGRDSPACVDGLTVTLAAPVGERAVVDGSTGRRVEPLAAPG